MRKVCSGNVKEIWYVVGMGIVGNVFIGRLVDADVVGYKCRSIL